MDIRKERKQSFLSNIPMTLKFSLVVLASAIAIILFAFTDSAAVRVRRSGGG